MNLGLDCIPCMLRQALREAREVTDERERIEKVLRASLQILLKEDWEGPPTLLAQKVHSNVRRILNVKDPYAKIKRESNEMALKFYPKAKEIIRRADDPLEMAVRLSISGNIMDYAALESPDLYEAVNSMLKAKFAIDDFALFKEKVLREKRMTFFADNAGEIVFDRLLIETMQEVRSLPFDEIKFVVKGGPLVNDATEEDAKQAGILKMSNLRLEKLSNGEPSTGIPRDPKAITPILSELNIMKGQGNYEAFSGLKNVFFIMMVKCPVVSRNLRVEVGMPIIYYSR